MLYQEFTTEINRLKGAFGDKGFGDEKVKLLFKRFKIFSLEQFARVVNYLILNKRLTPVDSDFTEALDFTQDYQAKDEQNTQTWEELMQRSNVSDAFREKWIRPFLENKHTWTQIDYLLYAAEMEKEINYTCKFCEDDGFVHGISKASGFRCIFYCPKCELGKEKSSKHQKAVFWEERFGHGYEVKRKGL